MLMASYVDIDRVGTDQSRADNRTNAETFADKGLPENYNYVDTGCELAPSCLECPLAICKYDDPTWHSRSRTVMRDQEIVRLRTKGLRVADIAKIAKTSDRTVYRVIQRDLGTARLSSKRVVRPRSGPRTRVPRVPMKQLAVWQQHSMREMTGVGAV